MHRNKEGKLGDWEPPKSKTMKGKVKDFLIKHVTSKMDSDIKIMLWSILIWQVSIWFAYLTDHFVLRLIIGLFR